MKTEIFNYNGNPITFKMENGEVMVSANQMAKPFKKLPADWLRLKQTKEYITALSGMGIHIASDLVVVKNGNEGGTIMHEDVAMEFARWLSPHFAIWCNSKIKELLKNGVATISDDDDEVLARAIEVLQKRVEQKMIENQELEEQLSIATPKAEYYDEVMMCDGCYTTTLIAKELGMSAISLNELLFGMKIQYRQSGVWLLYSKYQSKGYTKTHTQIYQRKDGREGSRLITVWTEVGREFIHKLIKKVRECGDLVE